jgi:calcium-translocating P-type ATPase
MKYNFSGLTDDQVLESRAAHGSNALSPPKTETFWDKLLDNFRDPIIIILCVALLMILVLSFFDRAEWYEALAIFIAVLLATFVSTLSEYKNELSFQKLQEEASLIRNNVFRNGHLSSLLITEIVVGDHILLQSGDKAPADGVIVQGEIKVNQASLTGESESVTKQHIDGHGPWNAEDLSDERSLFRGSVVEDGEAIMQVQKVGDHTIYGKLAQELSRQQDRPSPLQIKLKRLAQGISRFGYIAASFIAVAFMFNHAVVANHFDGAEIAQYFSTWDLVAHDVVNAVTLSIIIVVAAIPEGLPMMIAIVLSLNMQKLLKEKVLVRKLLGIETAGSLNTLFVDKTGTITKGQFKPKFFISGDNTKYSKYSSIPSVLKDLLVFSILENTSSVVSANGVVEGGNTSGRALIAFLDKKDIVEKAGVGVRTQKNILFTSARKFSATQVVAERVVPGLETQQVTLVKGAPEVILNHCVSYFSAEGHKIELDTEQYSAELETIAREGLRLIAIALSEEPLSDDNTVPDNCMLLGVVGIWDEIREEARPSIDSTEHAGIQVVMITGDRRGTAFSIAEDIGLLRHDTDIVLTSAELNELTDEEVIRILPDLRVVARALPTDKSRLVRIAKSMGKVAGMTGDGVNDSPALKQADVSFAMGSGSEVSKEASDIVLLDDNIKSITNAIRYGRTIFKSIRKFIVFQLTVNLVAVSLVFLGPFFGVDFPLTIIQLLWVNIIMDTLAAIAFGGEPPRMRYMNQRPVDRQESILTTNMKSAIVVNSIFITLVSLIFLTFEPVAQLFQRNGVPSQEVLLAAFFNLFVFMITINAFNARTEKINLLEGLRQNKGFVQVIALIISLQVIFTYVGGTILRAKALTLDEWLIVLALALLVIPIDLLRKVFHLKVLPHFRVHLSPKAAPP